MRSIQPAVDTLSSHVALLDTNGVVLAVNKAWRDFSDANGGGCDYVGWNYLEVCRQSAADGSKQAARTLAGLTRILSGASRDYGQAYECRGAYFRLRAVPVVINDDRELVRRLARACPIAPRPDHKVPNRAAGKVPLRPSEAIVKLNRLIRDDHPPTRSRIFERGRRLAWTQ